MKAGVAAELAFDQPGDGDGVLGGGLSVSARRATAASAAQASVLTSTPSSYHALHVHGTYVDSRNIASLQRRPHSVRDHVVE